MTTARTAIRKFHPKLCLLGAPGSGKGSYGKILSRHWGIPIITVSDVLHQYEQNQPSSTNHASAMSLGKLVDDSVVSQALLEYFAEQEQQQDITSTNTSTKTKTIGYILDGFPRTIQQVRLMEETWPSSLQINAAVHLNVPAHVCERKLLGRRICTICGNNYNVNGVLSEGFDLPPKLPRPGECHALHQTGVTMASLPHQYFLAAQPSTSTSTSTTTDSNSVCNPATARHWTKRDDDEPDIIHHRLEVYTQHTRPILEHFQQQHSIFEFVPYKGFKSMPKFQAELEDWVVSNFPNDTVVVE